MKKLLAVLVLALAFAGAAHPMALRASDGTGSHVTIMDSPCESQVAVSLLPKLNAVLAGARIRAYNASMLQKAAVFYEGKHYAACWVVVGQNVIILDESGDGDIFPLPVSAFRELPAI